MADKTFLSSEELDNKEVHYFNKVNQFFSSDPKYVEKMLDIIERRSSVSIRVLDWFITNYSKQYGIFYKIRLRGKIELFNAFSEYKAALHGADKDHFDPFCRQRKIAYSYTDRNKKEKTFETSLGQLKFFMWALRYKVVDYVEEHLDEITEDNKLRGTKKEADDGGKLKKKQKRIILTDESESHNSPDPDICSTDSIKRIVIGSEADIKKAEKKSTRKKRHELSDSAYRSVRKIEGDLRLEFD